MIVVQSENFIAIRSTHFVCPWPRTTGANLEGWLKPPAHYPGTLPYLAGGSMGDWPIKILLLSLLVQMSVKVLS